ncbi:MAG: response regulator [Deinococcota bacterium]
MATLTNLMNGTDDGTHAASHNAAPAELDTRINSQNEPQVLIAEDEYLIAASIRESLLKYPQPLEVVIVQRGRMLVENLKQLNPDVLIMDINLRGLVDGIEAVKRIQQTRNIPVIYITADSRPATLERAQTTQPVAYLTKPFKDHDLHEALSRALQGND